MGELKQEMERTQPLGCNRKCGGSVHVKLMGRPVGWTYPLGRSDILEDHGKPPSGIFGQFHEIPAFLDTEAPYPTHGQGQHHTGSMDT